MTASKISFFFDIIVFNDEAKLGDFTKISVAFLGNMKKFICNLYVYLGTKKAIKFSTLNLRIVNRILNSGSNFKLQWFSMYDHF